MNDNKEVYIMSSTYLLVIDMLEEEYTEYQIQLADARDFDTPDDFNIWKANNYRVGPYETWYAI